MGGGEEVLDGEEEEVEEVSLVASLNAYKKLVFVLCFVSHPFKTYPNLI